MDKALLGALTEFVKGLERTRMDVDWTEDERQWWLSLSAGTYGAADLSAFADWLLDQGDLHGSAVLAWCARNNRGPYRSTALYCREGGGDSWDWNQSAPEARLPTKVFQALTPLLPWHAREVPKDRWFREFLTETEAWQQLVLAARRAGWAGREAWEC